MRILIVDDDQHRQTSLRDYLVTANVVQASDIYTAGDVKSTLDLLHKFHFDVLVLDVVLPKDNTTPNKVDSKNGINLLTAITRNSEIKKPSKVIGITAHLEDLGRFQKDFQKFCLTVIEANKRSVGWRKRLAEYIGYDNLARTHREIDAQSLNVITIHGIRTFGEWQTRLKNLVHTKLMPIAFHSYRYGYASFFALFSSERHSKEIDLLTNRLTKLFSENPTANFIIFSHSFGTYLITEATRHLINLNTPIPIKAIVLAGSVLPNTVDLSFLNKAGIKVINECATEDYVLWLSEAFVPHLGMAGKTGIYGFEGQSLTNRYFTGGHSSYFDGDNFMTEYWLPLIGQLENPRSCDARKHSSFEQDFLERIIVSLGAIKLAIVNRLRKMKRLMGML